MNKRILKIVLFSAGLGAPFTLLDASPAFFPEGFSSDLSPASPGRPFFNPRAWPGFRPLPPAVDGRGRFPVPARYSGHFKRMPQPVFRPRMRAVPMHAGNVPPRYAPYARWRQGSGVRPPQFRGQPQLAAQYRFRPMPRVGVGRPIGGMPIAGNPKRWAGPRYAGHPGPIGHYRFRPVDLPPAPYRGAPPRFFGQAPAMASFGAAPGAYRFRPVAYARDAGHGWRPAPPMRYAPQWRVPAGAMPQRQLADYRFRPDPRFQSGQIPVSARQLPGLTRQAALGGNGGVWLAATAQASGFAD